VKGRHVDLNNFKYSKIVDYIYFEQAYEVNINKLKIGDFFLLETFPSITSNYRSERFYGKLLRKTASTFSFYKYCDSTYTSGSKEFIYKKSLKDYEKLPITYSIKKIKMIKKVSTHEETEKVILSSVVDPSTFMDPKEYKLIK
jgi:hypothetical protein